MKAIQLIKLLKKTLSDNIEKTDANGDMDVAIRIRGVGWGSPPHRDVLVAVASVAIEPDEDDLWCIILKPEE